MTSSSIPTNRFHDFAAKLLQPAAHESLEIYLDWQRAVRKARVEQQPAPAPPLLGPISINLDLTTACNYACDHCIDWESLNSPVRHQDADLRAALTEMAKRGLRSVILIGGGEPTLHPGFVDMVQFLKEDLGQQVAVVTNGSRNEVIAQAAEYLEEGDWVRLSLDSGTDATFQAMHHPKKNITLDEICTSARLIREANNQVTLGFSFVITWEGAQGQESSVVENLGEMAGAARLAAEHNFDYISFKPFLVRAEDGAEVLEVGGQSGAGGSVAERIRQGLSAAREATHEFPQFRVIESTNLRVFLENNWKEYTRQPGTCHMQALRQVVSPLGTFNCPAHRGVEKARLGGRAAWMPSSSGAPAAAEGTARLLDTFDAARECAEVTCLYNPVNHFLEDVVSGKQALPSVTEIEKDFFL